MQKARFNFKEKEGKFFAPIVGTVDKKTSVNGVITSRPVPKAGVKGTYAMVRLSLPITVSDTRTELFAMSTETFISSK